MLQFQPTLLLHLCNTLYVLFLHLSHLLSMFLRLINCIFLHNLQFGCVLSLLLVGLGNKVTLHVVFVGGQGSKL